MGRYSEALYNMTRNHLFDMAEILLDMGADPTLALCDACETGDVESVKFLLCGDTHKPADTYKHDSMGWYPLQHAVYNSRNIQIAKLILIKGSYLNLKNPRGTRIWDLSDYTRFDSNIKNKQKMYMHEQRRCMENLLLKYGAKVYGQRKNTSDRDIEKNRASWYKDKPPEISW